MTHTPNPRAPLRIILDHPIPTPAALGRLDNVTDPTHTTPREANHLTPLVKH
jgi:hypothetical protein